jgi:alternate signal-mediated exported protein
MNKLIKASLAGAAGVALLTGGLGTYATWTDTARAEGHDIQSGVLDITAGNVVWDDQATVGTGDWTTSTLLVPGDVIKRTQTFTVRGDGKNLKGTIKLTGGAVTKGGFGDLLDVTVQVNSDNAGVARTTGNDFKFVAPFGTGALTAVVTYKFDPNGTTTAQEAQNATASIAESTFTIAQTPIGS